MRNSHASAEGKRSSPRRRNRIARIACNLLLCLCAAHAGQATLAAQSAPGAQGNEQAQIEQGKQVVAQVCVACHTNILRMMQVHRQTPEQWRETVYSMIGRGAQIMPPEIDSVTVYLSKTTGTNGQAVTENSGRARTGVTGQGQEPRNAEGRAILQRSCQQCHNLETASTKPAGQDWNAVVSKMLTYGVRLNPADQQKLVAYLNGLTN